MARGFRKNTRKTEINMVPFLDVLLTVLLIFMIATPAVNLSIDVNVPRSSVAAATEDQKEKDILVIEVHSDSTYTLLYNIDKYTNLSQSDLTAQMNKLLEGKDIKEFVVQVAADQAALYNSVVNALTLLKQYGIVDIGLITNASTEEVK